MAMLMPCAAEASCAGHAIFPGMIQLSDADTGAPIGTITDAQLQFLIDQLEEESSGDCDYYINAVTLDMFATNGADPALLDTLRRALGSREDMEIRWSKPS